jgi:hypothetical protein
MADVDQLINLAARNADGSGNAPGDLGEAFGAFARIAEAYYTDGRGQMDARENARDISNKIAAQTGETSNEVGASDLFTFFGQLVDHDLDLALDNGGEAVQIAVPEDDPLFGEGSANPGITSLTFRRSHYMAGTGDDDEREHANALTSFLDSSNIYGSHADMTKLLRAEGGTGAKLLVSDGDNLPTRGQLIADYPAMNPNNVGGMPIVAGGPNNALQVAGDIRAPENIALTSMHTIWMREHNHQVDRLAALHPEWNDEQLFQSARIIVEAEMQHVIYKEWLPILIGHGTLDAYTGYDSSVDPRVTHEFATAAFRLGHTLLPNALEAMGEKAEEQSIPLGDAFFQPHQLAQVGGVDAMIRGLADHMAQEFDETIVDGVRNQIFVPGSKDLAFLNIMRGRDHGIPPLNDVRDALGLERYDSFSDISSDPAVVAKFEAAYSSIDNVDLWIGGLAEDNLPGAMVGETLGAILAYQFQVLRDGDKYYYEHRLAGMSDLLAEIEGTSFSDIIMRTTGIEYFQDDAFIAHDRHSGTTAADNMEGAAAADLMIGWGGNDALYGYLGDDDLYGGYGRDWLEGGGGRDLMHGEAGNDQLLGQIGDDTLCGDKGRDMVDGGKGHDIVCGDYGRDTLVGGSGNDTLEGGGSADQLWGGRGADVFVYGAGDGRDVIHDFKLGVDKIDLDGVELKRAFRLWNDDVRLELGGANSITIKNIGSIPDLDVLFI